MSESLRSRLRPLGRLIPVALRRALQASLSRRRFVADPGSDIVVSMTTFPERLECAVLAMECVIRQRCRMKAILLVLSRDQFQEGLLPRSLKRLQRRGVTLVFDDADHRSFKKLIPALAIFSDDRIVTLDDDFLYPKDWVAKLVEVSDAAPGAIIGHHGRVMELDAQDELHHATWRRAERSTSSDQLFLLGGAGTLYPANSLSPIVRDLKLAMSICPTEDDSWFFGCSVLAGSQRLTTGWGKAPRITRAESTPSISEENSHDRTDEQFQAMLDALRIRGTVEGRIPRTGGG